MFSNLFNQLDFQRIAFSISGEQAFHYGARSNLWGERPAPTPSKESEKNAKAALDRARQGQPISTEDLMLLLSPHAQGLLEEMAHLSMDITRQRFGNVIQIYAPLYLSNECRSGCTYCGFSQENDIPRRTLTVNEAVEEASTLHAQGIRHILLLTGEDYRKTPLEYIAEVSERLSEEFPSIGVEVYPMDAGDYADLRTKGVDSLAVYQETYDPNRYKEVHLRGVKKDMFYRLDCADRGGMAGLRRISIGALLGLSDPAAEVYFAALHARYLMKTYWQTQISISLPRFRPASGVNAKLPYLPDRIYAQYFFALRIFLPDVGLFLSTRESAAFRDQMCMLGITHMSAGSRTNPGGYSGEDTGKQFEIEDQRPILEICNSLVSRGLEPVFTDWSPVLK